jgi:diaminopimelate epimerase
MCAGQGEIRYRGYGQGGAFASKDSRQAGRKKIVSRPVEIDGTHYGHHLCFNGNPHCVVFADYPDLLDVEKIAPRSRPRRSFQIV